MEYERKFREEISQNNTQYYIDDVLVSPDQFRAAIIRRYGNDRMMAKNPPAQLDLKPVGGVWNRAIDVPKADADDILERFDQTDSTLQRQIVLQAFLDKINASKAAGELLAAVRIAHRINDEFRMSNECNLAIHYVLHQCLFRRPLERNRVKLVDIVVDILAKEDAEPRAKPPIPPA